MNNCFTIYLNIYIYIVKWSEVKLLMRDFVSKATRLINVPREWSFINDYDEATFKVRAAPTTLFKGSLGIHPHSLTVD